MIEVDKLENKTKKKNKRINSTKQIQASQISNEDSITNVYYFKMLS